MSAVIKKEFSIDEIEAKYSEVTALYEFAEEVLGTVESQFVTDPSTQLDIVEPLINELGDATDILAEEFILLAESKRSKSSGKASKLRIEAAFRKIYSAVHDYQSRVIDVSKKAHGAIQNIADPIVNKIKRHVEHLVVVFLEFVQFSLQSIMNKTELDALKQRDARVAFMLHQMSLAQHQS